MTRGDRRRRRHAQRAALAVWWMCAIGGLALVEHRVAPAGKDGRSAMALFDQQNADDTLQTLIKGTSYLGKPVTVDLPGTVSTPQTGGPPSLPSVPGMGGVAGTAPASATPSAGGAPGSGPNIFSLVAQALGVGEDAVKTLATAGGGAGTRGNVGGTDTPQKSEQSLSDQVRSSLGASAGPIETPIGLLDRPAPGQLPSDIPFGSTPPPAGPGTPGSEPFGGPSASPDASIPGAGGSVLGGALAGVGAGLGGAELGSVLNGLINGGMSPGDAVKGLVESGLATYSGLAALTEQFPALANLIGSALPSLSSLAGSAIAPVASAITGAEIGAEAISGAIDAVAAPVGAVMLPIALTGLIAQAFGTPGIDLVSGIGEWFGSEKAGISKKISADRTQAAQTFDSYEAQMADALKQYDAFSKAGSADPDAIRQMGDSLMSAISGYYRAGSLGQGPSSYAGMSPTSGALSQQQNVQAEQAWLGLDAYLRSQGLPGLTVDPVMVRASGILSPRNGAEITQQQNEFGGNIPAGITPIEPTWGELGPPPVDWAQRGSGPAYDAWVNAAYRDYSSSLPFTPYAPPAPAPAPVPAPAVSDPLAAALMAQSGTPQGTLALPLDEQLKRTLLAA